MSGHVRLESAVTLAWNTQKDLLGEFFITLGTGSALEFSQLQAYFDESKADVLSKVRNGSLLTVNCRITGLMMNVLGQDCMIEP